MEMANIHSELKNASSTSLNSKYPVGQQIAMGAPDVSLGEGNIPFLFISRAALQWGWVFPYQL